MGRPKRVIFENFHLYDKLHTKKSKMYSGVELTTLYPIKETAQFYVSIEVWAYCASNFRGKKDRTTLNVDIPVVTDEKAVAFLAKHGWKDWVAKQTADGDSDITEAIALLDKIFPDKKKVFFYELDSLIGAYCGGTFISYDDNGNVEPRPNKDDQAKYYNQKYNGHLKSPELEAAQLKWTSEKDKKKKDQYLTEYVNMEEKYAWEHNNLVDVFIEVCRNSVCYPVAFSRGTADWSKEKYGKEIAYAKVGEIFFVTTPDTVYFQTKRHY